MKTNRFLIVATFLTVALASGCTNPQTGSPAAPQQEADTNTTSDSTQIPTIVPKKLNGHINVVSKSFFGDLYKNVTQSLVGLDHKNRLAPAVASSWIWESNTELLLNIRPGVFFANGEKCDAAAIVESYKLQLRYNKMPAFKSISRQVKAITAPAQLQVRIVLTAPNTLFLHQLAYADLSTGFVLGAPDYIKKFSWSSFVRRPVSVAPFMVKEVVKDPNLVADGQPLARLEADLFYYQPQKPHITAVNFLKYQTGNIEDLISKIQAGDIDLVDGLAPQNVEKYKGTDGIRIYIRPSNGAIIGALNLLRPDTPLRNLEFRRALNYAVNVKQLIREVTGGYAIPSVALAPPGVEGALIGHETYRYDSSMAYYHFQAATDGTGQSRKLVIICRYDTVAAAQLIAKQIKATLGVECQVNKLPSREFARHLDWRYNQEHKALQGKWDIALYNAPDWQGQVISFYESSLYSNSGVWRTIETDETIDNLVLELMQESDRAKRVAISQRLEKYTWQQAYMLFLYSPGIAAISSERLFYQPDEAIRMNLENSYLLVPEPEADAAVEPLRVIAPENLRPQPHVH